MSYATIPPIGPDSTPSIIKNLIFCTVALTLLSAATQTVFNQFGFTPGPQNLLSLSWWGMKNFYVWQPLTFLFVQSISSYGITFLYLITLFFNMYILWVLGSALVERVGKGAFLRFYLSCGILAGIISLLGMPITGQYAILGGPAPAIVALFTAWSMAFPESEVLLFFLIPVKAKWLVAGILGAILLVTFSQWNFAELILYISAIGVAYVYASAAWGWHSPFFFTQKFDAQLAEMGLRLRPYFSFSRCFKSKTSKGNTSGSSPSKVVDISTGKMLTDDDAFIDEMLAKISKGGEGSLRWSERRRMKQISEKKIKDQQR